jgi:hypothetical protein
LGTLLVSKFQQIAMSRQAQQIESRRLFNIFIDEFANFITPSMAEILSGTRKYRVGLTLAHHELHQLQRSPEVASAVMTHSFTRVVFRVGDDDAKKLAEGLSFFEAKDLRNLEIGHAICRVERSDFDFNLSVPLFDLPDAATVAARRLEVITVSRRKYGTARADVEAMLAKSRGTVPPSEPVAEKSAPIISETETPKAAEKAPPFSQSISPLGSSASPTERKPSHTAVKQRIGSEAEELGYTVSYEELFPSVHARADVVLRLGDQTVYCQISDTTPTPFEAESVRKLLALRPTHIAVVSTSSRKLMNIRETLQSSGELAVGFYSPDEIISKLREWAGSDPADAVAERSKPTKRKIDFSTSPASDDERRRREREGLDYLKQVMGKK